VECAGSACAVEAKLQHSITLMNIAWNEPIDVCVFDLQTSDKGE
jgi:hypothetical protein